MSYENNELLKEVSAVPGLLRKCYPKLLESTRQFFSTEAIFDIKNIYLTGCGDSYMAALCAELAFERLTGLNVFVKTSMAQSCYTAPEKPAKNSLVIGLSNSGETSRVVEAVGRMRRGGCRTAALTCNGESRLAREAGKVLLLDIPKVSCGPTPGVGSFMAPLMALYLLAIRFGEVRGCLTMDTAGQLRRELERMAGVMDDSLRDDEGRIDAFARLCMDGGAPAAGGLAASSTSAFAEYVAPVDFCARIEILGAGPAFGAAKFGAAKLIEALGVHATAVEMEEFAHVEYFECRPQHIPTIVLGSKKAAAAGRIDEVLGMLQSLGRPALYLDHEDMDECWLPMLYCLDLAMLAGAMCRWSDEPYFRGFCGVWENGRCAGVKDSRIFLDDSSDRSEPLQF